MLHFRRLLDMPLIFSRPHLVVGYSTKAAAYIRAYTRKNSATNTCSTLQHHPDPPPVLQKGFKKYCCKLWSAVGSNTGALVPKAGDFEHKFSGAPAIAWLGEVKQNRVQKAVHAGKRPGALIDDWKQVSCLAGRTRQSTHHQVQGLGEVKRQEAYAEHCRHHNDHLHRLVPLLPCRHRDTLVGHRAAEDVGHPAVAHHNAHKGQQEAEAGQSHAIRIVVHWMLWRA